jgi:chondroitin AC lyase
MRQSYQIRGACASARGRTALVLCALLSGLLPAAVAAPPEFEAIKARVIEAIRVPVPGDDAVDALIRTLAPDGTWPGINYKDVSRTGFDHRRHTANLVTLARAWRHPGSKHHRSPEVRAAVERALRHWVERDYTSENWWHNQIGTPEALVHLLLLMGEALPADLVERTRPIMGRAHLNASGARPSGDRIKIAGIWAKQMLWFNRVEEFTATIRVIEGEIRFSAGPGLQPDFSFHHRTDGVDNTLAYGVGYAAAFAEWLSYVAGTRHAFSEEKVRLLTDYYLDGICRHLVHGVHPDPGARNRGISRRGALRPFSDPVLRQLVRPGAYRLADLQAIAAAREGRRTAVRPHSTFFWRSEYFAFQRPGFFTSVRMHSSRTHTTEVPYNSEGVRSHHRGDGANHVLLDGTEYLDIWPVYDWQKIPGATLHQKPALPPEGEVQKRGRSAFVGGVTDGRWGAAVFDFKSAHDPLSAKKAWFFFDDLYVCLGADIRCEGEGPVVTTLNQCLWRGPVLARIASGLGRLEEGERSMEDLRWVLHDGIGYVFFEPVRAQVVNQTRTGTWRDINRQSSTPQEEVRAPVFALWLDHGVRPRDAAYAYAVVPGTTPEEMEQGRRMRPVRIFANGPEVQAVGHAGLNLLQAVLYAPGTLPLPAERVLTVEQAGLLMWRDLSGAVAEVTVSDPTRQLSRFRLSMPGAFRVTAGPARVLPDGPAGSSRIEIDLPRGDQAGRSVTIRYVPDRVADEPGLAGVRDAAF